MDLDAYAHQILDEAFQQFPIGARPVLQWRRFRVTAGIAYPTRGTIALSSIVLTTKESVRETLLHEYAHLLAVHRHGRSGVGHGQPWKQAMRDLGLQPKVRHNYEVQRNQPRQTVIYRCARCGADIVRKRRLPRRRRYVHAHCGGEIALHGVASHEP